MSLTELPIAETFTSIHGEGFYAGTPMTFIRTAGCSVGKPSPQGLRLPILSSGRQAWECTTWDGRHFPCDTDFHLAGKVDIQDLMRQIPDHIRHVCITGGEPLMHQAYFELLFDELAARKIVVHIETSGTIMPLGRWAHKGGVYFACSPKVGYKEEFIENYADEVRVLVDPKVDMLGNLENFGRWEEHARLYFAPIARKDDVDALDPDSMEMAIQLVHYVPGSRISIQMHKVLGVR